MKIAGALLLLMLYGNIQPKSNKLVQFDIHSVLNARPVTTLTDGKLITWNTGIDGDGNGDGNGDGYLTKSAAKFNGDSDEHALPDQPSISSNSYHPEIQLHYANDDSTGYQACSMRGETSVTFSVPKGKYTSLYFALTSAEGASKIKFDLTYVNGESIQEIMVPDYYKGLPENDSTVCYLVHDLAKWGPSNKMTEKDHHNIDLAKISTDPKQTLLKIKISKEKAGYVVFWGAAGKS
jgi:hypothetical protein